MPVTATKQADASLQVATAATAMPSIHDGIGVVATLDPEQFEKTQVDPLLSDAVKAKLAGVAASLVDFDRRNEVERNKRSEAIEGIGDSVMKKAAVTSKMLDQSNRSLFQAGQEGSPVANALVNLKTEIDKINPQRFNLTQPGGIGRVFSKLPFFGNKINRYFTMFQSSSATIEAIVLQLRQGTEQLKRDNSIIQDDQVRQREIINEVTANVAQAMYLLKLLEEKAETFAPESEDRKFIDEKLRFPLSQKIRDLQALLAVNQQGYLSFNLIRDNNLELVRGARRCESVTITALKIAVQVALALNNQRIVLRTIKAIDDTTNTLLMQNAATLKTQGVEIQKQAVNQGVSIEALKQSFADIESAFDDLARFKSEALPVMRQHMTEFSQMSDRAAKAIDRIERGDKAREDILDAKLIAVS